MGAEGAAMGYQLPASAAIATIYTIRGKDPLGGGRSDLTVVTSSSVASFEIVPYGMYLKLPKTT